MKEINMDMEENEEQTPSQSSVNATDSKINQINAINGNGTNGYVRRRRCNEQVQVCEKKKKRDVIRRVSVISRNCSIDCN